MTNRRSVFSYFSYFIFEASVNMAMCSVLLSSFSFHFYDISLIPYDYTSINISPTVHTALFVRIPTIMVLVAM
ncbi:hypothetical protein K450DRAFT_235326 [Umbelopsis ramanniana AG]|uniref:Uncharacterized protein n=1 Tax=Umbelopsis ramanniana AG TaxID=1314678 RepID=A0AAD5HE26_UMBRA|nr:uncharacterized protein K450DRAFT_235326 [Umbelopsis ramanniana AG]KAI8580935.1 hypothetical protein K450DRAFT_235326 [Umbelopsis ramanniana AG]